VNSFGKESGVLFFEAGLVVILNAVGEPPEFRPSGGADEPGT
jgi:hypothetical protein